MRQDDRKLEAFWVRCRPQSVGRTLKNSPARQWPTSMAGGPKERDLDVRDQLEGLKTKEGLSF